MKRKMFVLAVVSLLGLHLHADTLSDWLASIRAEDRSLPTDISVGEETIRWYDDGTFVYYGGSNREYSYHPSSFTFPDSGVVATRMGSYCRLELNNYDGEEIEANGCLAIYAEGNNRISGRGILSDGGVFIGGRGSLTIQSEGDGVFARTGSIAVAPGVLLMMTVDDKGLNSFSGDLILRGCMATIVAQRGDALCAAEDIGISDSLICGYSGECMGVRAGCDLNIACSAVDIFSGDCCLWAKKNLKVTTSYFALVQNHEPSSWAWGYPGVYGGSVLLNQCYGKVYSRAEGLKGIAELTIGKGKYYIGSLAGRGLDCYNDDYYATCAGRDTVIIDGGDVKICAPNGTAVFAENHFDMKSGSLEIVDSFDVSKGMIADAEMAFACTGVAFADGWHATMEHFYSQILTDAIQNALMSKMSGQAFCGVAMWYGTEYEHRTGTLVCDKAQYGFVTDKFTLAGGVFKGDAYTTDFEKIELGTGTGGTGTAGGSDTGGGGSGTGGGQTDDPWTVVPTGKWNISVSQSPYLGGADMVPRTEFSVGDQLWCGLWGVKATLDGVRHCYDKPLKVRTTLSTGKSYDNIIKDGIAKGDYPLVFLLDESLDLAEGDYTLTCELDPDGEIEETIKSDNKCSTYFRIVNSGSTSGGGGTGSGTGTGGGDGDVDKWNLQVYDFGMYVHGADNRNYPRTEFLVGEPMLYYADIRSYKNGVLTQSPGHVKSCEKLSSGTTWTSDWEDGVHNGRECWYSYMPELPVGEYTLEYTMDPNGAFQDCNPADNSKFVRFRVVDKPTYNLAFDESLRLTNAKGQPYQSLTSLAAGQEVWVNAAFRNATGYAVPSQVECRYRLYANGKEAVSFTRTCTLDTETRITDSFRLDEKIALPIGDCKLTCQLDSGNTVPETNESDNMRECSFKVKYVPKFEPKGVFFPKKAVTLYGALLQNGTPVGVVELKVAKQKSQQCKVSGKLTGLEGRKKSVKGLCRLESHAGVYNNKWFGSTMEILVPDIGTFNLQVGANGFSGVCGNYTLETMAVGGNLRAASPKFSVAPSFALGVPGELRTFDGREFVPVGGVPVQVIGSKWGFGKAATIRYARVRGSKPAEYALQGFDDPKKPNISGLKLNYSSKKGMFNGSFKVYALDPSGMRPKLKKYVVNVNGFVVDGIGYGEATLKKPAASWPVTIE